MTDIYGIQEALKALGLKELNEGTSTGSNNFGGGETISSYSPTDGSLIGKVTTTTKEEVLECKDGYDGPNYWELFAQFYYSGISVPAYCRPYARPNHPFKTPGMLCLTEDGVWEKQ